MMRSPPPRPPAGQTRAPRRRGHRESCDEGRSRSRVWPELSMRLTDLLTSERVAIHQGRPFDKNEALKALAQMLAKGTRVDGAAVERVLTEREQLQSTGIGEGVAIPHGALPQLDTQHAGLLIV